MWSSNALTKPFSRTSDALMIAQWGVTRRRACALSCCIGPLHMKAAFEQVLPGCVLYADALIVWSSNALTSMLLIVNLLHARPARAG